MSKLSVRKREMQRLILYAKGMGLKVYVRPYKAGSFKAAEWALDGTELWLYVRPKESKVSLIISLIHELGHHKDFIHRGRRIDKSFYAIVDKKDSDKTPSERKMEYDTEMRGTRYWREIYHESGCSFSIWKLYAQMEIDMWHYEHFFKTGRDPSTLQARAKRKEVKARHRAGFDLEESNGEIWDESLESI